MSNVQSLEELFVQRLRYAYDTEQRLTKALPKLSKAAHSPELKQAFDEHLKQTETHVDRAQQVFNLFGKSPNADTDEGIKGIVDAGEDAIGVKSDDPVVKDAGLIAAAQHAEHYEMATYGTLRTWAEVLGRSEAVQLLEWTLEEEKEADRKLTQIASRLNVQAAAPRAR